MSKSESKASNVLGGKTARACDSCLIKRARWFCGADDAFLCQPCDATVHSANQLASRHERVRLETSSFKVNKEEVNYYSSSSSSLVPAWHQGFTRKARTPRQAKSSRRLQPQANDRLPLVPEINSEEPFQDEININDEQLFCRVPVLDETFGDDINYENVGNMDLNIEELLLSNCDEELAEFAADVESLLGTNTTAGVDQENLDGYRNKELQHNGIHDEYLDGKRVKLEDEDDEDDEVQAAIACHLDPGLAMDLNWDLDYEFSMTGEVGEEMKRVDAITTTSKIDIGDESGVVKKKKRMLQLRLNHEAVIAAWATQRSPWTDGVRPHFNLDEFLVACLGGGCDDQWGSSGGFGRRLSGAGREARVSRYREKRRTRLFSKKIRYQVRKLNAEKRPRMKGRFVKRTTFSGSSSLPPYLMINK